MDINKWTDIVIAVIAVMAVMTVFTTVGTLIITIITFMEKRVKQNQILLMDICDMETIFTISYLTTLSMRKCPSICHNDARFFEHSFEIQDLLYKRNEIWGRFATELLNSPGKFAGPMPIIEKRKIGTRVGTNEQWMEFSYDDVKPFKSEMLEVLQMIKDEIKKENGVYNRLFYLIKNF